jgi:hypothetical protein
MHFFCPIKSASCLAHLILLYLITRIILVKSTDHKAPRCVLLFTFPCYLVRLWSKYLPTLFSNICSLCFSFSWETKFHTHAVYAISKMSSDVRVTPWNRCYCTL